MLMLRGFGPGLFQALANLFAAELEWTLRANGCAACRLA
jgi:hypothetical protein